MAPSVSKSKSLSTSSTVSLKLLIDKTRKKVLFAEAGKDFFDFLFALLSLPLATVTSLLSEKGMVGSLGKLYDSVQKLNQTYMQPNLNKDVLLKPKQQQPLGRSNQVLPLLIDGGSNANKLYTCPSCRLSSYLYRSEVYYVADDPKAICPQCRGVMSKPMTYVATPSVSAGETSARGEGGGFVREFTYMIMDDLQVKPLSAISSMALLNTFNVTDVRSLEERVVPLDMDKGLKLLKASLQSNAVLTKVFLSKKLSNISTLHQIIKYWSWHLEACIYGDVFGFE